MAKILVIDDEAGFRGTLRIVLTRSGFTVAEAENGREGLKAIEAESPDLVLIDVVMPEQDGFETIPMLRDRYPALKIIAITGGGPMEVEDLLHVAKKLGATECLAKPFESETLLSVIQRVLNE